ncbi:MAG: lysophospholipid acyltransferase family protein [Candidatus Acidiferrales bacterium]
MPGMRERVEVAAAWIVLKALRILPRPLARMAGASIARLLLFLRAPLRHAAMENLRLAFPGWSDTQRRTVIRGMARQAGWLAAEFAHLPALNRTNLDRVIVLDDTENFRAAQARGKGVLFLTGHMSAWELGPYAHALHEAPLHFLVRAVDNSRVDALVERYRCLSGNTPIEKGGAARAVLRVLRANGVVGILADHNASRLEGVFVNFFGVPACTTAGLARFALHTGAAVVPAFVRWDPAIHKYRLAYQSALTLVRTGDEAADVVANTQLFMDIVEAHVRRYPDQWLWVHRRWRERPAGETSSIYDPRPTTTAH